MAPMKRRVMWQLVYHKKPAAQAAAPEEPEKPLPCEPEPGSFDCQSSTDGGNGSGAETPLADDGSSSDSSGPTAREVLYTKDELLRVRSRVPEAEGARCPLSATAAAAVAAGVSPTDAATAAAAAAGPPPPYRAPYANAKHARAPARAGLKMLDTPPATPPARAKAYADVGSPGSSTTASPTTSPGPSIPSSPEVGPGPAPRLPPASPTSWAEARRLRRQQEEQAAVAAAAGGCPEPPAAAASEDDVKRRVKSILNKLTPEKFATLYTQLMQCGIDAAAHVGMVARVIFEEAIMQHGFSGMYADLCMYMIGDFGEEGNGSHFKYALLDHCTQFFERAVGEAQEAIPLEVRLDDDVAEEAQVLQKKRTLGNVRFAGELLVRHVFPAHFLFACTGRLLQPPLLASSLEALATLLTVVGPTLDNAMWPHHAELVPIFWHVRGLTFDPNLPRRARCLLRDVVDLRDAGWIESKAVKKTEKPMMLEEVRQAARFDGTPPKATTTEFVAYSEFGHDSAFVSWDLGSPMELMPAYADDATYAAMHGGGHQHQHLPMQHGVPPMRQQQQPHHAPRKGQDYKVARFYLGA